MAAGSSDTAARPELTLPGYRALGEDVAVYRDGARRVLRVTGERAPAMLQGLVTADIADPGDGAAWPSLILNPKGRVLADAVIVRVDGLTLLDVPEASRTALDAHLDRYLPPRFAALEPTELAVFRVRGPRAIAAAGEVPSLAAIAAPVESPDAGVRCHALRFGEGAAVRVDDATGEGLDLYLAAEDPAYLEAMEGVPRVADEAWEIWRIERGVPLYGRDFGEDNLPQETGLVSATTSFTKGCYTGQEVLARIHYRGKVNRRLVGLRLADGAAGGLEAGQRLLSGEREIGAVTSAARSPRIGWIGLGYARREVEAGSEVCVETSETSARIVALPFPSDD